MSCIISLETATKVCSVALSVDKKIVFEKVNYTGPSHAVLLGVFVKEVIEYAHLNGLKPQAIAVSSGPGSYTGLRIGISEAKGLCYGLDIPLIAIPTPEIMALQIIDSGYEADFYCPMIDARRMEVYSAVYDKQSNPLTDISAEIIDKNSYLNFLSCGKMLFFGDGSIKCKEILQSENAEFIEGIYPLAKHMAPLAEKHFINNKFENIAYFEPFYLKEFQATKSKNIF